MFYLASFIIAQNRHITFNNILWGRICSGMNATTEVDGTPKIVHIPLLFILLFMNAWEHRVIALYKHYTPVYTVKNVNNIS